MQRHQMPQEPNGIKDVSLTIAIHICNQLRRLGQIMQMVHSCVISTNVHVPLIRAQQLVRHVLIRRVRLHVRVMLDITAMVPLLVLVVQHVKMVVLGRSFDIQTTFLSIFFLFLLLTTIFFCFLFASSFVFSFFFKLCVWSRYVYNWYSM